MKRDNINYLVVGSVVIAAMLLFLYVLYRLTGGVGENDLYFADYDNVGGLSEGTPVTYQGYRVGSVSTIAPLRQEGRTRYRVSMLVRDGWKIPADSVAQIYSEGLLAETVINIEEGASPEYLSPGSELAGRQGADIFEAINTVAGDASALINGSVRPLMENLDSRVSMLGQRIDTELPLILADIRQVIATLQEGADRIPRILNQATEDKVHRVVDNAEEISGNLRSLSEELLETRKNLDWLLSQTHHTIADNREDFRQSVATLRRSLEMVSVYLEGIMHNLESTSRNMNEFSREIRDNPGLLLGGKSPQDEGKTDE